MFRNRNMLRNQFISAMSNKTYSPALLLDQHDALLLEQISEDHKGGDLLCENSLDMGGHIWWNRRKWRECLEGV